MGKNVDLAVIRRRRSLLAPTIACNRRALAMGCMDSIAYVSGRVPTSNKPRVLATLGSYVLALCVLVGILAALARMAH